MMMLAFAALGLLLGLLSGGSLRGLARYPLAGLWLPLCALLVKSGAAWLLAPQTGAAVVCLIQYSLLFVFLFLNRRRPLWPLFVFAGSLCNLLVIVLNGGCMPVSASLLGGAGERLTQLAEGRIYAYCLMDETTRLPFLGDVIRIGPAGVPIGFASVGDVALCIGAAMLIFMMTRAKEAPVEEKTKNTI
ncbi:MAG: DUF5317 domain-containing protein [Clostridiales bacterium]|nr:DUF5317 domain-containing protein [Clostridiales bacterium]